MQKFLMSGLVLALFLLGTSVYLLFRNNAVPETVANPTEYTPVPEAPRVPPVPERGSGTLQSLLDLKQNLECTIMHKKEGVATSSTQGTMFTSQGRLRGDFILADMPKDAVASMILLDETLYSWTEIDNKKYGVEVPVGSLTEGGMSAREPVALTDVVSYECALWEVVDGSVFEVPQDIIFTSFDAAVQQGMEYGTVYEPEAVSCAMCLELVPELRAQCRANLACE